MPTLDMDFVPFPKEDAIADAPDPPSFTALVAPTTALVAPILDALAAILTELLPTDLMVLAVELWLSFSKAFSVAFSALLANRSALPAIRSAFSTKRPPAWRSL